MMSKIDLHLDEQMPLAIADLNDPKTTGICKIYAAVRPVLEFAKTMLFFKPKWQKALGIFIGALDSSCNLS